MKRIKESMFEYLLGWCRGDLDILYKTLREFKEEE